MLKKDNGISREFEEKIKRNNLRGYALSVEFETLNSNLNGGIKFSTGDLNTNSILMQLLMNGEPIQIKDNSLIYVNILKRR